MPSQLWAVRTSLLATFTAPATTAGAVLFDGPRKRGDVPKLFLVVGADSDDPFDSPGEDPSDTLTGAAVQTWAREGPGTWREESGSILCTAVAWSGDDEFAALRALVEALVDECELALRADPELDGLLGSGAELGELRVWERRSSDATAVGAVFAVAYQSTLT